MASLTAKVVGAGSIGNHLAHALRAFDFDVVMVDTDLRALDRTKTIIYPQRYGAFDEAITLALPQELGSESFDLCVIGTPPDTHLAIATEELEYSHRALLIEKPLAPRGAANLREFAEVAGASGTRVMVAYNQRLKHNTVKFMKLAEEENLGPLESISARMKEDWTGILKAHPWLTDATQSYLGHMGRGGGALYEHSHATDFVLFIAGALGHGRPDKVRAELDVVIHETGQYDREARLAITTTTGLNLDVVQDLFTWPAEKSLTAEFVGAKLTWEMHSDHDLVRLAEPGKQDRHITFPKTRPDDFLPEIAHVMELLGPGSDRVSPLDLAESLHTSLTLEAAVESHELGDWVPVRKLSSADA
mgnify:CR=1 FL=1